MPNKDTFSLAGATVMIDERIVLSVPTTVLNVFIKSHKIIE